MTKRHLVRAVAATTVLAVTAAGAWTPANARPATSPPRPAPVETWRVPDRSLDVPAESVVTDEAPRAGRATPLTVVSVHDVDGRPEIVTERVRGRRAAVSAVAEVQADRDAVAVGIDSPVRLLGAAPRLLGSGTDPYRGDQWALDRLAAEQAWTVATGSGAVVAVVDTGVDATHPDLEDRVVAGGAEFLGGSGQSSGDGTNDVDGHGTHVAGIVAAEHGNGLGVVGLAPESRILPVRVLGDDGWGDLSDVARGILHAVDRGADVVNLSLGGTSASAVLESAVAYARDRGVVVVAAAGNEGATGNAPSYPAAFDGVVAVGSSTSWDGLSSFSNTGSYLDVAAPGQSVLSTFPGARYATYSGTSMASPYVAAAAALAVDATDGALDAATFDRVLHATAHDLGATGWDERFGHGLVQPGALLAALGATAPAPTTDPEPAPEPVADEPTPTAAPAPTRRQVRVRLTSGGGAVRVGGRRAVSLRVTDTAGRPVPGHRVLVVARRGGRVVARRPVLTAATGRARAVFVIRATTRFAVFSPPTTTTAPASSRRSVLWRAVPRLRLAHPGRRAVVRVVDRRGRQRVQLQQRRAARWVTVRAGRPDARGRAVVRALPRGVFRVRVTPAGGLAGVTTRPWRVG